MSQILFENFIDHTKIISMFCVRFCKMQQNKTEFWEIYIVHILYRFYCYVILLELPYHVDSVFWF